MNDDSRSTIPGPDEADLWALSAFVDNALSEPERAAILERLANDPQASARIGAYQAQNAALKALFATPQEQVRCIVLPRRVSWWQRARVAAIWLTVGVACGIASGWVEPSFLNPQPAFARRAEIAYAVYAPEQRHPVEVAAAEEEHLIKWLSKRLERPLTVPSLQEYGYTLVGGRLLPGESGPAAQFMFQNGRGQRLTLYVSAAPREATVFRLLRDGRHSTFYWVSQGMGYALSGDAAEPQLRAMAIEVCGALGGRPAGGWG